MALVFLLLVGSGPLFCAVFEGRVVRVVDGDTVDVLVSGSETIRIRLSGIDAPESKQAFGTVAKRRMSEFVFGQLVQVEWKKRDRYGRIVGKIFASQGDAGLLLIHDGLAWHYKKYEAEQSPVDRLKYGEAEKFARAHRLGVWSMPNPIAPWDFRRLPKSERQSHG